MQLGNKGTTYLAVALVAVGFFVIFLGWNGAADRDAVEVQLPYVISGGIAGLGLVATGLTLALVQARRDDTAKLAAKLDRLIEDMEEDHPSVGPEPVAERMKRNRARRRQQSKAS